MPSVVRRPTTLALAAAVLAACGDTTASKSTPTDAQPPAGGAVTLADTGAGGTATVPDAATAPFLDGAPLPFLDAAPPTPDGGASCPPNAALECAGPFHVLHCGPDGTRANATLTRCPEGRWCENAACAPPTCISDDDCHSDTYCNEGACTPYPDDPRGASNPGCGQPFGIVDFSPEVQCRWTDGEISMGPIALDLDGDQVPEVLFVTAGEVVAIRGDDCSEEFRSHLGHVLSNESAIAAGDVDGDGMPEVVALGGLGQLFALDNTLALKWAGGVAALGLASAPAIADLDGDGHPEVIVGGTALNGLDGSLKGRAPEPPAHGFGPIPAIADVDGDGRQEVLYGNRIYDADMHDVTPDAMRGLSAGHVAVADFDPVSPGPELAVVAGQTEVRVQRLDGTVIFGPYQLADSLWAGGAPNVADFDGDGRPEIGTAGSSNYGVFDLDCVGDPLPAGCAQPGLRWMSPTRDGSSGSTGSTTFDFEGDGKVEVIYNDECFLRIYDGTTGDVRLAMANTTGTLIEAPIVLDVDGDYNSEIVVGSDQGFPCEDEEIHLHTPPAQTQGLTILRDVTDRWVHSRPIWNQNAYSITNVEDNGAIPAHPEASWLRFNSFRQNAEPEGKALQAPDLTAKSDGGPVARTGCGPATLAVTVSNRGAQPMPRGVNVVFSAGSDATGPVVCQTTTTQRLLPGESEAVTCEWAAPPAAESLVYVQVDVEVSADGVRVNRNTECAEGNNWTVLEVPGCG